MEHLITIDEFKELARPTSIHVDESEVTAYIRESEDMNIIPAIGYDRYKRLLADDASTLSDDDKTLLSGGEYTVTRRIAPAMPRPQRSNVMDLKPPLHILRMPRCCGRTVPLSHVPDSCATMTFIRPMWMIPS
jgi:hypothetical protein